VVVFVVIMPDEFSGRSTDGAFIDAVHLIQTRVFDGPDKVLGVDVR
jgi:hypothetical protein